MNERFTVGTVTGWPITDSTLESPGNYRMKASTVAYVYDSAYCYRTVAEFRPHGHWGPRKARITNVEAAQALADKLNVKDAEPVEKPRRKRKLKRSRPKPRPMGTQYGHFTEYQGYVLYVTSEWIFVYDRERNLRATVTAMPAARLTVQRLKRERRRQG